MSLDTIIEIKSANIFQNENLVLSGVNLAVDKGEFIYLIGKVGSGKSSLVKTINAELPLKEGTGVVAGFDLVKIKRKQIPLLRRKMGIVFQDFQLLSDRSVYDNLLFVLKATGWKNKAEIKQRISDVLEKVGLQYKDYKLPHQLSGGEQQRVVIARALLNNPEIILADEPTGNLDPETSDDIMKLLVEISKSGRAVIMATHNYGLLKKFPARTIKCEKGQLCESVAAAEIDFESLME
ncbi:cell division ATP-binding protein FtsE [Williamwhitmania taraxaci]|uniref:Cell division ATP-binding protein FtsE n=1 Tax=Williamwhitmania taraxaci TaxID=1640674 RepID=A0A1G6K551_9BACT|nr:ATP-binding cassette domain-containing protein [Williamwhitmania taraxaci]SDC26084.1 cell division transport system ATP-binding protein [Williamwhitmania taraxaci]